MKKTKWFIAILMLLASLCAQGNTTGLPEEDQLQDKDRDEAFYFFAPGPVLGFYYFEYQRALTPRHSVNAALEYANFNYAGDDLIRLWAIYRYKLRANNRGPLDGVFFTPALQLARSLDGEATILNSLLYVSHQRVFEGGLSLQTFAGIGYGIPHRETEKYKMYTGFSPSLGVSLGYTF